MSRLAKVFAKGRVKRTELLLSPAALVVLRSEQPPVRRGTSHHFGGRPVRQKRAAMNPLVCVAAPSLTGMEGRFLYAPGFYPTAEEVEAKCWLCFKDSAKLSAHADLCPDCLERLRHESPA